MRSGEETPCVADIHSCEDMTQHGIEIRLGGVTDRTHEREWEAMQIKKSGEDRP